MSERQWGFEGWAVQWRPLAIGAPIALLVLAGALLIIFAVFSVMAGDPRRVPPERFPSPSLNTAIDRGESWALTPDQHETSDARVAAAMADTAAQGDAAYDPQP